jgi:hypothetical protein
MRHPELPLPDLTDFPCSPIAGGGVPPAPGCLYPSYRPLRCLLLGLQRREHDAGIPHILEDEAIPLPLGRLMSHTPRSTVVWLLREREALRTQFGYDWKKTDVGRGIALSLLVMAKWWDSYAAEVCADVGTATDGESRQTRRNGYRVVEGEAFIQLMGRRGEEVGETLVDAADLETVLAFGRWRMLGNGYVATTRFENGKRRDIYLHRHLTVAPSGAVVDHINALQLDNRRQNLRVLTRAQNMQNRRGGRTGSATGIRNVSYSKQYQRYKVVIGGKFFGRFDALEEATKVAERNRSVMLPYATAG